MYFFKRAAAAALSFVCAFTPFNTMEPQLESERTLQVDVSGQGSVFLKEPGQEELLEVDGSLRKTYPDKTSLQVVMEAGSTGQTIEVIRNGIPYEDLMEDQAVLDLVMDEDVHLEIAFEAPEEKTESQEELFALSEEEQETEIPEDQEEKTVQKETSPAASDQEEILADYANGITEPWKQVRLELAASLGLSEFADEEGFMSSSWCKENDLRCLENMGGSILNPVWVNAVVPGRESGMKTVRRTPYSSLSVSGREFFSQVPMNGGGWLSNYLWQLSNGAQAFCGNWDEAVPAVGAVLTGPVQIDNANLRKVLYYGYNGVENILASKGWSRSQQVVITNDLVSMAYVGGCLSKNTSSGYNWTNTVQALWNEITAKPDPVNMKVYMCQTSGSAANWNGVQMPFQPLIWGEYNPTGWLRIKKSSAIEDTTQVNPNYTLKGAVYDILKGDTLESAVKITRVTLDEYGLSESLEVEPGRYWAREITPPAGYRDNPFPDYVDVSANSTALLPVMLNTVDFPKTCAPGLVLKKTDSETGQPLAGALFEVKHSPGTNAAEAEVKAERTWIFKTDENGEIYLDEDHKVSGDDFYRNSIGAPVFPLGVVTIREIQAPEGYYPDPNTYTRQITENGTEENIEVWNMVSIAEVPISIRVIKAQKDQKDILLSGAEFTLTYPSKKTEVKTTDANGTVSFRLPQEGTYTLKETKAPEGYVKNEGEITFTLKGQTIDWTTPTVENFAIDKENHTVRVENDVQDFDVEILKTNELEQLLDGAKFALSSSPDFEEENTKILTTTNGVLCFNDLANGKIWYLKEIQAPAGYELPVDEEGNPVVTTIKASLIPAKSQFSFEVDGQKVTQDSPAASARVVVENSKATLILEKVNLAQSFDLQMIKTSEEGELLDDALFALSQDPDFEDETTVTRSTEKGILSFEGLDVRAKWYLKEIKAPLGYLLPEDEEGNIPVTSIQALLEEGKKVHAFEINGNYVDELNPTDEAYVLCDGGNALLNLTMTNVKETFDFELLKTTEDGEKLDGALFAISSSPDFEEEHTTVLETKDGILKMEGLEALHPWYVKEIQAPAGCLLPEDEEGNVPVTSIQAILEEEGRVHSFEVNGTVIDEQTPSDNAFVIMHEDKALLSLIMTNAKETFDFELVKTTEDGALLDEAVFAISSTPDFEEDNTITLQTKEGILKMEGLEVLSKWYIKEIQAPAGFLLPKTEDSQQVVTEIEPVAIAGQKTVTFLVNGEEITLEQSSELASLRLEDERAVLTLNLTNKEQLFSLRLLKKNESGQLLEGARFVISDDASFKEENTKTVVVSKGSVLISGLSVNKTWYVKEIQAPEGYILDDKTVWTIKPVLEAGVICSSFEINGSLQDVSGKMVSLNEEEVIVQLEVINEKKPVITPETTVPTGVKMSRTLLWAAPFAAMAGLLYVLIRRSQS